jgi:phage terminase large subunit
MLKNGAGITSLFVDPKCKHTIDSLTKLTYKEGTTQVEKNGFEHQADAVGYLVDYLFPVRTHYPEVEEPLTWGVGVRRFN